MAEQISRIKFEKQNFNFKTFLLCQKTLIVGLIVIAASISQVRTTTCPNSVSPSVATTARQCSFTGFSSSRTYRIVEGPVSSSLYYSYLLNEDNKVIVRKEDASGSQSWMSSFLFMTIMKSLAVDIAEQNVYLVAHLTNILIMLRLSASDGSIISQHSL